MRKVLISLVLALSVIALILRFGWGPLNNLLNTKQRAGLRIQTNLPALVFLNNNHIGNTPFQDENLKEGEYLVTLKDEGSNSALWQGYVKLYKGTVAAINRDFAQNLPGAGEVVTLQKGKGATVVSNPPNATVSVNGAVVGKTPLSLNLPSGDHNFLVTKDNYINRSIRANLADGYNITLNVDLALTDADLTKLQANPVVAPQVVIKQTPTGFLRVRATPSTSGQEVARVVPGETLTLLEEVQSWYKIKTADGKEGYISSSYAEKK